MRSIFASLCMTTLTLLPLACGKSSSSSSDQSALPDIAAIADANEGAIVLKSKDQEFSVTQNIPAGLALDARLLAPFSIVDTESRQQKWKHCGFLGTEVCRSWKNTKVLSSELETTHIKVELLVNGVSLAVENPFADVQHEKSTWMESGELANAVLPLDELLGDPFFAAQKNFKFMTGDSDLEIQGRLLTSKGSISLSPGLSAFGNQELSVELRIKKTSESGVVIIHQKEIKLLETAQ